MGLVQYESSDEDDDVQVDEPVQPSSSTTQNNVSQPQNESAPPPPKPSPPPPSTTTPNPPPPQQPPQPATLGPILGPALGPPPPPPTMDIDRPAPPADDDLSFLSQPPTQPPRSPYTATRALLRDLTLPALPNMDIPPSPPSSPRPAGLDALNAKFDTFLRLKRAGPEPQHFNARLAASESLRNPALADKLLGFAGADEYGTTLGKGVWDPRVFPGWAFKAALRTAHEEGRSRGAGEKVEFVSAGSAAGATGTGAAPVREGRRTMFDT
ncbi:HCNGP-like protein-domain-containing protein [Podospora conica]|nr:HCNGP-like protein-domain-containing protein [Schizothecium conicum]